MQKKKVELLLLTVLSLLVLTTATPSKALDGVPYVQFEIEGKTYDVPIPNSRVKEDFYLLKKSLSGDFIAREILLGKDQQRMLFIGDNGINRWCIITRQRIYVKEN